MYLLVARYISMIYLSYPFLAQNPVVSEEKTGEYLYLAVQ